jgi:HAE1 family hydrophobic/amphiphilic exporter-1
MIFISFFVIGLIALNLLPLEFFPAFDGPFLGVWIPYNGSTPEETERQITRPVEEALAMVPGIKEMFSHSSSDAAFVGILFQWGTDIELKSLEAREKLDGIKHLMPEDFERFYFWRWKTDDEPILTARISSNRDLSGAYEMLNRNVVRRIQRIEGVSKVELYGVQKKEIEIQLILDKVIAHNIDIYELQSKLANSNFSLSAGKVMEGSKRLLVKPIGEIKSVEEVENIVVGEDGIRLKDIAVISYDMPELDHGRHLNRKYAIGLNIFKSSGANTVGVCEEVMSEIERISQVPEMEGINIYFMFNQAEGIKSSLSELFKSGIIGAILATLILYFFLRKLSNTLIVVLSVPFSLLVTITFMYFMNISLNILSMMGLMLAVGMLVDNSVVAMESVHRHQAMEENNRKAILTGVSKISLAITAGTLTTVIVFLPNIFNSNNMISIQLKHVGLPLIIALIASLIIAQTVVPLLTFIIKNEKKRKYKRTIIDKFTEFYSKILSWKLNHHKLSILIMILVLLSTAIPINCVKQDMNPPQDNRKIILHYNINDSYALEKVEESVDLVEAYLFSNQEKFDIESVYSFYSTNRAASTIILKTGKDATRGTEEIIEEIKKGLPKFAIGNPAFEWKRTSGMEDQLTIHLMGKSSERLIHLSKEVAKTLELVPGFEDVQSDAEAGDKEVHVIVDRTKAKMYGFSTMEIARVISVSMRGSRLPSLRNRDGEIDVRLSFREEDKADLADLKDIPLTNRANQTIKLASVANFEVSRGPRTIRRQNRNTSMSVSMNLAGLTVNEAKEKIREVMNNYNFPVGYSWSFGRRFNFEDETGKALIFNIILGVALIYFVMAGLFESFVFPAAIWLSIIFAIVGVWWFFLITGTTLTIMAWIGVLILSGVVVNNGIVLIDHINQLRNMGIPRNSAILQAGEERMRPILMTAGTTVLSMIPLCLVKTQIGGEGPPYFPMARAIVGGLTFSTIVTLLILPTIYVILDDLINWGKGIVQLATEENSGIGR